MKYLKITSLFAALLFSGISVMAQSWDKKQEEVWKAVEDYSAAYQNGEYDKFMSAFHDDYKGWSYNATVPSDKKTVGKYVKMGMDMNTPIFSNRTPLSIQVYDDFAVVHYLFHNMSKNKEDGDMKERSGRWTDILMKDQGKWFLIADHGGVKSGDD